MKKTILNKFNILYSVKDLISVLVHVYESYEPFDMSHANFLCQQEKHQAISWRL